LDTKFCPKPNPTATLPASKVDDKVRQELLGNELSTEPEEEEATEEEDKFLVPEERRLAILKEVHDQPATGHPGMRKTLKPIKRFFY
jgi:hypothetical protein